VSTAWLREGGELIIFFMLAVGNTYSKTSGSGKGNICAVYLSCALPIYLSVVGENMEAINIGTEGEIEKRICFKTEVILAENDDHNKQHKMTNEEVFRLLHTQHNEQRLMCFHL